MAFWMEIRCDGRSEVDYGVPDDQVCWSNDNSDPQDMSGNSRESINRNITHLHRMARTGGWRFIKDEWLCPGCLKRRGFFLDKPTKSRKDPSSYMTPEEAAQHKNDSVPIFPEKP